MVAPNGMDAMSSCFRPGSYEKTRRAMPKLIQNPSRIRAAGNKVKIIDEFVGRVNSQSTEISIARMRSPAGWREPGQTPEFDEYTVVLKGVLQVEHKGGVIDVVAGQAIITKKGEWVRY